MSSSFVFCLVIILKLFYISLLCLHTKFWPATKCSFAPSPTPPEPHKAKKKLFFAIIFNLLTHNYFCTELIFPSWPLSWISSLISNCLLGISIWNMDIPQVPHFHPTSPKLNLSFSQSQCSFVFNLRELHLQPSWPNSNCDMGIILDALLFLSP